MAGNDHDAPEESVPARRHRDIGRRAAVSGLAAVVGLPAVAAPVPARPKDGAPRRIMVGPGLPWSGNNSTVVTSPSISLAGGFLQQLWSDGGGAPLPNPFPCHMQIAAAPDGYYDNDCSTRSPRWRDAKGVAEIAWPPWVGFLNGPIVIEGEHGKPAPLLRCRHDDGYLAGDGILYEQQGWFICAQGFDVTFRNLRFQGMRRRDGFGNYRAVAIEAGFKKGNIVFDHVSIADCDDGILGGSPGQTVELRNCFFTRCGYGGTGSTHNCYIDNCDQLIIDNVLSTECKEGHLMKSRAARTIIRNSVRLLGEGGTESACLDVPDAGELIVEAGAHLVCAKSDTSHAYWVIHYSGENQDGAGVPFHEPSRIEIAGKLTMIGNSTGTVTVRGSTAPISGFVNQSGNGAPSSGKGSHLVTPVVTGSVDVFRLDAKSAGFSPVTVLKTAPAMDTSDPSIGG
jgi:hypothetical protein